jgi:hypothetical protein
VPLHPGAGKKNVAVAPTSVAFVLSPVVVTPQMASKRASRKLSPELIICYRPSPEELR